MSFLRVKSLLSLMICAGITGSIGLMTAGCRDQPVAGIADIEGTATAAETDAPVPPEMPQLQQPPQPEPLEREELEDEEFPADTVIAEVNGSEIKVKDVHDFILEVPAPHQMGLINRQHEILEELISRKVLMEKAEELEIADTDEYETILEMMKQQDMSNPEEEALLNTLFQKEVVAKAEISEDDLRELYEEYKDVLPEEMTYEEMRPNLREIKLYEHIDNYISQAQEGAEIEKNEEWVDAQETAYQLMMEDMQQDQEGMVN